MLNLAITTFLFALGSGAEALKSKLQHGVYFRKTRIWRQLVMLFLIGVVLVTMPGEVFARIFTAFVAVFLVLDWVLPYDRMTIHIRNGSHEEAREELENVLEEEGYEFDIDVDADNHYVYRIPSLGKTKLTLKEKEAFIEEEYGDKSELSVLYTGFGNPLKEAVELYLIRMRELRFGRSGDRTWLWYAALSALMLIFTGFMIYQAWHSPMEYPNQRMD